MNVKIEKLIAVVGLALAAGCAGSRDSAALPLKGMTVVAPDAYWQEPEFKPPHCHSMDAVLLRSLELNYNWGGAAAADLTNALTKVTGAPVALIRESEAAKFSGPVLYLGDTQAARERGLVAADMRQGEWRIACDGTRAFICAKSGMGAAYGVTDFLAKYANYRFLTIDGDDPFTVDPQASVPVCDYRNKHAIYERHFSTGDRGHMKTTRAYLPDYLRRLGLQHSAEVEPTVRPSVACGGYCHTYLRYCPLKEYAKDHPEYFSMFDDGTRHTYAPTMLCLSNPEVLDIVTERMLACIAEDREKYGKNAPSLYDFSQSDCCEFICHCPKCRAISEKYGSDMGLQLTFVNELARRVARKHPDVFIRIFAYVSTEVIPKGIRPEPNVMIWYCDLYSLSDHQLPLTHPFNKARYDLLREWKAIAPKFELWDYMLTEDDFPQVSVDALAADARLFHSLGIDRIYHESQMGGQAFWELEYYVMSRMYLDPGYDLEKAIDEYCTVYGRGTSAMRRAIDGLRKAIAENPPKSMESWHRRGLPWRTVEVMSAFRRHVREAYDAETRPKMRARIALALQIVDLELYRLGAPRTDGERRTLREEFLAAAAAVRDGGFYHPSEREEAYARTVRMFRRATLRFERLPDGLKEVPATELKCFDITGLGIWSKEQKVLEDRESECEKVIRVVPDPGENTVPWVLARDRDTKRNDRMELRLVKGGGYRWYRLGVSRIGRSSDVYIPVHIAFRLDGQYLECDGLAEDPNWYEYWISVKWNGDPRSSDLTKGVFIDRLALRRVPPPRTLCLASNGRSEYAIVTKPELGSGEEYVLKDFRRLVKTATGVELPVVTTDAKRTGKCIYFGIAPDGYDRTSLEDQEHCVVTKGDDLYLFGGGRNGTRYAVYSFLQKDLGFRFFDTHGGIGYPKGDLQARSVNARRKFPFKFRYLCGGSGMFNDPVSSEFLFRHGQNCWVGLGVPARNVGEPADECRILPPHAHSLRYYLPADSKERCFDWIRKEGGPDLKTAHPEYFSLMPDGKRAFNHQYCLSNPGCRKLLTERVLENMRRHPECNVFDLSAGDTPGQFCYCPDCKKLIDRYGSVGGPMFDFMQEFCPKVAERFPENRVMMLAYRKAQTQPPPKGLDRLPDNFMPNFAPINDNFAKDWHDPSNVGTLADLREWCRLCRDTMVWYYPNPYTSPLTPPLGNVERAVTDLKLMQECGVTAHLWEHNVGVPFNVGFSELETYVYVRMMNDMSLDWRALADEFIDFEYGAAAPLFREYWLEQEELRKSTPMFFNWNPPIMSYRHLTPERLKKWDDLFGRMEKLVADDEARLYAVRRVRLNLDFAIISDYRAVAKAGFSTPVEDLSKRILSMGKRVVGDYVSPRGAKRAERFLKSLGDVVSNAELMYRAEPKPLPPEIFGKYPSEKIFTAVPKVFRTPYAEDPDAAFGVCAVFSAGGKGAKCPVICGFDDNAGKKHTVLSRIELKDIPPRGKYGFFLMGDAVLTLDCLFRAGIDDGCDIKAEVSRAWEFGSFNRATGWISLKFEGPAFYPEDAGKENRIYSDRVVVIKE